MECWAMSRSLRPFIDNQQHLQNDIAFLYLAGVPNKDFITDRFLCKRGDCRLRRGPIRGS